ncbi:MAG: PDZ domain-containing protein, partial [Verrucomicrobiales bacterium]
VLSHAVNANMSIKSRALVDKINGVKIEKMEDVIRAFETAPKDKAQHLIEFFPNNTLEAIERSEADQANDEIHKLYGVAKDRRL